MDEKIENDTDDLVLSLLIQKYCEDVATADVQGKVITTVVVHHHMQGSKRRRLTRNVVAAVVVGAGAAAASAVATIATVAPELIQQKASVDRRYPVNFIYRSVITDSGRCQDLVGFTPQMLVCDDVVAPAAFCLTLVRACRRDLPGLCAPKSRAAAKLHLSQKWHLGGQAFAPRSGCSFTCESFVTLRYARTLIMIMIYFNGFDVMTVRAVRVRAWLEVELVRTEPPHLFSGTSSSSANASVSHCRTSTGRRLHRELGSSTTWAFIVSVYMHILQLVPFLQDKCSCRGPCSLWRVRHHRRHASANPTPAIGLEVSASHCHHSPPMDHTPRPDPIYTFTCFSVLTRVCGWVVFVFCADQGWW